MNAGPGMQAHNPCRQRFLLAGQGGGCMRVGPVGHELSVGLRGRVSPTPSVLAFGAARKERVYGTCQDIPASIGTSLVVTGRFCCR